MLSNQNSNGYSRQDLEYILYAKSGYPKSVLRQMSKQDMLNELKNYEAGFMSAFRQLFKRDK